MGRSPLGIFNPMNLVETRYKGLSEGSNDSFGESFALGQTLMNYLDINTAFHRFHAQAWQVQR